MRAAGYRYVNIDDCWMAVDRDRRGNLLADPVRFPHGIKALGDYVHARGLRLGIYLDAGQRTCAQRPGSAGHFEQDARTVAGWGADFVKVDWCNTGNPHSHRVYARFRSAIAGTGRPMVFSICNWGMDQPWRWGPGIGAQMWRTGGDLTWYGAPPDWWGAVQTLAAKTLRVTSYAHPGAWNESDVVLVGTNTLNEIGSAIPTGDPATGSLSDKKARAQFSLWSMLAVPLFTDNELTTMSAATRATLLNKEVIAVDQDSLAAPSSVIRRYATGAQLWTRRLSNGDRALLAFNPGPRTFHATVDLRRIGLGRLRYRARDLWAHVSRPPAATVPLDVAPTSTTLLRLRRRGR